MRTWIRLIPVFLLAVPLTWSPLRAADEITDQKIKKLQDDVADIRKDVEKLKEEVKDSNARGAKVAEDLQDIKKILSEMRDKQAVISRQSGYGPSQPPPGVTPLLLPPTGTITVQNTFLARATVHINGRPFVVDPGQPLSIRGTPTGTFQYSVDVEGFGTVEPPRTAELSPAGYRITIFPRMAF